jgi:hypothetical protein
MSGVSLYRFACMVSLLFLPLMTAVGQDSTAVWEQRLRAHPDDLPALMDLGRYYYDRAAGGDDDAIERSFTYFSRAYTIDSTNVVALAYRGSLWTMRARTSWWPPTKTKDLKNGADEMDRAVEMDPGNIMVHLIRGINALGLPEHVNRLPVALEDFIVLLRHPAFPEQTKELKAVIFYYGGLAHKRADDYDTARKLFRQAVATFPGSEYARRAQNELNSMG